MSDRESWNRTTIDVDIRWLEDAPPSSKPRSDAEGRTTMPVDPSWLVDDEPIEVILPARPRTAPPPLPSHAGCRGDEGRDSRPSQP